MSRSKKNYDRLIKGDGNYYGDTRPGLTPPPNPLYGDIWIDTNTNQMYLWNQTSWVAVYGGGGSVPGQKGQSGSKGERGEKGLDGAKGTKGINGPKGEKGPKGDKLEFSDLNQSDKDALKGEKGEKGQEGDKGTKGEKLEFGDLSKGELESLKGEKGSEGQKGEEVKGEKGGAGLGINIIGEIPNGTDPNTDPGTYPCSTNGNALINDTTGGLWICDGTGNWIETPPLQGPKGGKGEVGEKGTKGDKLEFGDLSKGELESLKGEKGQKGQDGEKGTKGDKLLFSDLDATDKEALKGQKGGKGEEGDKGEKGVGEKGDLGPKGENGVFPEPNADGFLYGRSLSVPDPITGDSNAEWRRSVEHTGDVMLGALTSPTLITGPDNDDKAILKMDDGQDAYSGGPHELEARSGEATDWDAWIAHAAAEQNTWESVTHGDGKFVAVSNNGTGRVMYTS